jgi:hypothetical protein
MVVLTISAELSISILDLQVLYLQPCKQVLAVNV